MSNSIISGYNNTVTSTSISSVGSIGLTGSVGMTGTKGTTGHVIITDWKDDIMKKYPRFNIKTEYDAMTFSPIHVVTDKRTDKEYKVKNITMSNIMNETEQFIQELIITIRDEKITNIING